jgi:hypothetical protein
LYAEPHQESADLSNDQNQVDIIWQNLHEASDITTWRKRSRRSIRELLIDFMALVEKGNLEVISLSTSKSSLVAVISCDKNWADFQEEILQATR